MSPQAATPKPPNCSACTPTTCTASSAISISRPPPAPPKPCAALPRRVNSPLHWSLLPSQRVVHSLLSALSSRAERRRAQRGGAQSRDLAFDLAALTTSRHGSQFQLSRPM